MLKLDLINLYISTPTYKALAGNSYPSFTSDSAKETFYNSIQLTLKSVGFCPKENTKGDRVSMYSIIPNTSEYLHIHPNQISGYIDPDKLHSIENALINSGVCINDKSITNTAFVAEQNKVIQWLNINREEIKKQFVVQSRTKTKNHYLNASSLAKKIICSILGEHSNVTTFFITPDTKLGSLTSCNYSIFFECEINKWFMTLFQQLQSTGLLASIPHRALKDDLLIRTIGKTEAKQNRMVLSAWKAFFEQKTSDVSVTL